eukprot:927802-Pelagomonas_calceolata.AAC.2
MHTCRLPVAPHASSVQAKEGGSKGGSPRSCAATGGHRAVSLLHHKVLERKGLVGIWRVTGSTWLQNPAARSNLVFNRASNGSKLTQQNGHKVCEQASWHIGDPAAVVKGGLHAAAVPPPTIQASCIQSLISIKCTCARLHFVGEVVSRGMSSAGTLCGPVPAAQHSVSRRKKENI